MKKIIFILCMIASFLQAQTPTGNRKVWADTLKVSRGGQFVDILSIISDSTINADGVTIVNSGSTFGQKVFTDSNAVKTIAGAPDGTLIVVTSLNSSNPSIGGGMFRKVGAGYGVSPDGWNVLAASGGGYWVRVPYVNLSTFNESDTLDIKTDGVTTTHILDETIASVDLGDEVLISRHFAPGEIEAAHVNATGFFNTSFFETSGAPALWRLKTGSVTTTQILDATIAMADLSTAVKDSIRLGYTGTGLSEGSVTSTHILDGTIASGDLSTSLLNNVEMWKHVWNDSMVKTIGGVLRQDSQGSGWYAIDNSNHYPLGVFTVSNETNSGINVTYDATEYSGNIRGTFIAVTDEALAGKGVFLGSSVNATRALIELHARIKITGRIYNSGGLQITIDNDSDTGEFRSVSTTNWNTNFGSTGAMSISYSGIVSTGTVSVKATPRIAGGYIPSAQVSGSTVTFYMTDYAGSVVTTADANCDFTFEIDLGVCHLDPNKVYGSLANIWFWGVFYVDQP